MINLNQILTNVTSLLVFFVLLFTFTKILGPIPFDITQVTTSKTDAFTVTGEGKIEVKPDIAIVRVGVLANGTTVKAAQDELNKNINKVTEGLYSLSSIRIDEADVKTENYNITPNIDYNDGKQTIKGYQANSTIVVKVREVDRADTIVDVATSYGANQVGGIQFEVDNKKDALNKARELAVSDAKKKAEDAARIAGFKLGKVINYSESEDGDYPFAMMSKAQDARESGIPTQVQPGTNEIAVTVSLSYEIR